MHLKGQLHIHTTSSDGRLTHQQAADAYSGLDFNFIAFTDHDHLLKSNYRDSIRDVETRMLIFSGIELTISTRWGYVHVNRIEGDREVLHTFNHPGENSFSIRHTLEAIEDISKDISIDAVEITHLGFLTKEYDTDAIPYPKVATDDSHTLLGCGRAWIELDAARKKDSIIRAIKHGDFSCRYFKTPVKKMVIA